MPSELRPTSSLQKGLRKFSTEEALSLCGTLHRISTVATDGDGCSARRARAANSVASLAVWKTRQPRSATELRSSTRRPPGSSTTAHGLVLHHPPPPRNEAADAREELHLHDLRREEHRAEAEAEAGERAEGGGGRESGRREGGRREREKEKRQMLHKGTRLLLPICLSGFVCQPKRAAARPTKRAPSASETASHAALLCCTCWLAARPGLGAQAGSAVGRRRCGAGFLQGRWRAAGQARNCLPAWRRPERAQPGR